jgi:hypothetical protein
VNRKSPPPLTLGPLTVRLLRQGDTYPCPKKGHPPFTHERVDPAIALHMGTTLLRVIPLKVLAGFTTKNLCGSDRGRYWALDAAQVDRLKAWAVRTAEKYPAVPKAAPKPAKNAAPATVTPPPGYTARRARTHPVANRGLLNDCDYLDKLSPEERAWKDQFDRETILNRWYDREGVEPFYTGEERRKLQFEYNRRYDDLMNSKEWWPTALDRADHGRSGVPPAEDWTAKRRHSEHAYRAYADILPSSSPNENEIIEAIDRSRE